MQCAAALAEASQVDYYEGVVYDNAARLLRHEALYQPLDRAPYSVAAYTPVYPILAAGLRAILGDGFGPGRGLSVVAGLVTAYAVGRLTTARCGRTAAGVFAAALFLALTFPGVYPWLAVYRVDLLGVAFAVASMAVLDGDISTRRTVAAGVLASLAVLTKQLLFGAALAGSVWLWQRNRRQSLVFATCVAVVVGLTCAALELSTDAFFANTVQSNVNPMRLDVLLNNLGMLLAFQTGPLVAALVYVVRQHPGQRCRDLVVVYWLASWLPLVAMSKVGAYHNYWIETAAATAILASVGVWSGVARRSLSGGPALVAIAVGLLLAGPLVSANEVLAVGQLMTVQARNLGFERVVARVRSEPKQVLAEPYDAVVLAGRPVLLDTVIFSILYHQGAWDPSPMLQRICSGQIGLLVLSKPIEDAAAYSLYDVRWWPPPVMASLRDAMRLESVEAGRYLYVARQDGSTATCR